MFAGDVLGVSANRMFYFSAYSTIWGVAHSESNFEISLTKDLPTFGTVDQKNPRQSGSSKIYGRIRVNRRMQLSTVCLSLSHTQPESAFNTSLSTACKTNTQTHLFSSKIYSFYLHKLSTFHAAVVHQYACIFMFIKKIQSQT